MKISSRAFGGIEKFIHSRYPCLTEESLFPESKNVFATWTNSQSAERYKLACRFVKGKNVLDIGCGWGLGTKLLRDAGAKSVAGCEINPRYSEHAIRNYGSRCTFITCSALNLPLTKNAFDVVTAFEIIEHIPPTSRHHFIAEAHRVMRRHGKILISSPNKKVVEALKGKGQQMSIHHRGELTKEQLTHLVSSKFRVGGLYRQTPFTKRLPLRLRCTYALLIGFTKIETDRPNLTGLTSIVLGEKE